MAPPSKQVVLLEDLDPEASCSWPMEGSAATSADAGSLGS